MAEAIQTLLNESMKLEQIEFLRAAPGERNEERTGYANGFEDKTTRARVGELALRFPQARPLLGDEPLVFTSEPAAGEEIGGDFFGELLSHASLDADECGHLLDQHGLEVLDQRVADPARGGHTVRVVRRRGTE